MDESKNPPPGVPQDDVDALETSESELSANAANTTGRSPAESTATQPPKSAGLKALLKRFNIYLLAFLLLLILAGVIIAIAYFQSKKATTTSNLQTQSLTQNALQQVANSDANVGSSQQILNVQSSTVFAGKVLIRDSLEVAGSLQVGGTVALNDMTVSGTSAFGQVQINKNLSVAGDTGIQGALTIAKSLQVNSSANFSGPVSAPQLTIGSLQLNSDLVLTHHILAGGATPGRSNGTALGSGGTATVSGSDTGGTITVNTGSNPPAGCFITVNFTQKYNSTPHVLITPVGADAGSLSYYVTRNSSGFSVCDSSTPPSGTSFGFDYFVVD